MGRAATNAPGEVTPVDHVDCNRLAERRGQIVSGQHVGQQTCRDDLSLGQQHAVAETGRNLLDVMGDQDQRRGVGIGGQIGQPRYQLLAPAQVETGRGFVEQQQLRVGHQRPCDEDPLALTFRQGFVGAVGQMLGAQAFQHVDRTLVVNVLVAFPPPAQHRVTGRDDQVAHHLVAWNPLRQRRGTQTHPRAQLGHVDPAKALPQYVGDPRRGMLGGRGDPQQRRLAGAVGPDDHPAFVELDRPGHRPDQGVAVAAQRYIGEVDQQVGVGCLASGFGHPTIVPYRDAMMAVGSRGRFGCVATRCVRLRRACDRYRSGGMSTRLTTPSSASAASISPRVTPSRNSTVSRYGWLSDASATSRSAGFALNATPKPAAASMSMSLAPSPTATVCAIGTPTCWAKSLSALALPARSMIWPTTRPVSLPSTTSSSLAATKSSISSCANGSMTCRNPPETTPT